jgi:low affinity Fe/Cu permease
VSVLSVDDRMALARFSVFVSVLVCVCLLQQQDTINEDIVEIDDKMDTLKTHLKSKFGSQVQF